MGRLGRPTGRPAPLLSLLLLVVFVVVLLSGRGSCNELIMGARQPNDSLLFEFKLIRYARFFQILSETVSLPMTVSQRTGTITLIEVQSPYMRRDDIRILDGGVGQRFVNIRFVSALSRGLDYTIKVYGVPDKACGSGSTGGDGGGNGNGDGGGGRSKTDAPVAVPKPKLPGNANVNA